MKRGASKRMMLLIAGVGAILLLVTLGYMLANHREGKSSPKIQKKTATKATIAKKLDPKIVQDLQLSSNILHKESSDYHSNQNPTPEDMQRYISHFGGGFDGSAECPNLSTIPPPTFNYVYDGMTTCNVIKPSEYNGQGTATNEKTGEKITITKQMLNDALARVK